MDRRQRQEIKKQGGKVPTMQPCPVCQGAAFVERAVADLYRG